MRWMYPEAVFIDLVSRLWLLPRRHLNQSSPPELLARRRRPKYDRSLTVNDFKTKLHAKCTQL